MAEKLNSRCSSGEGEVYSLVVVHGLLPVLTSLLVEHRLQGPQPAAIVARDLPGPGIKPVSPELAGGFLTTAPPGKP